MFAILCLLRMVLSLYGKVLFFFLKNNYVMVAPALGEVGGGFFKVVEFGEEGGPAVNEVV